MQNKKKTAVLAMLLVSLLLFAGCKQNPSEEQLFSKLIAHFEDRGYPCDKIPLAQSTETMDVPIADASSWYLCTMGQEQVLIYFDESNRADYLASQIDQEQYGHVATYGLRFIVNYRGEDAGILEAMDAMPS
ncbi:MAG: hypothetical protein GX096_15685 [Clostridiales bacterium]|nr:hypothetical protein [Clostridiales bacterium]